MIQSLMQIISPIIILLIIGNALYFMFTGKFSLFGLDKVASAIMKGLGKMLGGMLTSIGHLIEDLLRKWFGLQPKQRGRRH